MDKKVWVGGIAAVMLLAGAGSVMAAEWNGLIGKDKAKEIALKEVPGTIDGIDFERENGKAFYEVEIHKANAAGEADVYVEALNGTVLAVVDDRDDDDDYPAPAAASAQPSASSSSKGSAAAAPAPAAAQTEQAKATSSAKAEAAPIITEAKAKEIALKQYPGTIVEVKTDWDDGIFQYEIDIKTADGEAEVEINATDGSISSVDYDRYDDDDDDDDDDWDDDWDDDDRYDDDRYDD